MNMSSTIDQTLIHKYDSNLPRYTSYPTAPHFDATFNEQSYREQALFSNQALLPKPLSIYIHIPFCHSLCYFCGCNKVVTQPGAPKIDRYLDALMREISTKAALFDDDRLVQQIHFGGGTPNFLNNSQLSEILEEVARCFHLDLPAKLEVGIELDPRFTSANGVTQLSKIGFNRFSIGVQDFSTPVQIAVNRVQNVEDTLAVIESACRTAGSVNVDLITGLPNQTTQSVAETVELIASQGVSRVAAYSFAYLPERIKAQRLINPAQLPNNADRLAFSQTVNAALLNRGYKHIGLDHYTLETDSLYSALLDGSLQRNFQGYTTHAQTDLVGLGVSAISAFDTAFAQNTTSVSEYIQALDDGSLPVVRGIALTQDDQLRQYLIQQIMCHGRVDLSLSAGALIHGLADIPLRDYFADELLGLDAIEQDGIVNKDSNGFYLTNQGHYFMRPVAALFDAYLSGGKHTSRNVTQFSRAI